MSVVICPTCEGRGYLRDVHGEAEDCEVCLGKGSICLECAERAKKQRFWSDYRKSIDESDSVMPVYLKALVESA